MKELSGNPKEGYPLVQEGLAEGTLSVTPLSDSGVRISDGTLFVTVKEEGLVLCWGRASDDSVLLSEAGREFIRVPVMKYTTGDEEPVIERVKTVDGERNFIKNLRAEADHEAMQGRLYFSFAANEHIHGFGQGEDGVYDYRGHVQYLYQHNMRIPMPMLLSDQGYGIFFDCSGLMTFNDTESGSYLYFDTLPALDYYFIMGESIDRIIDGFRTLTGRAAMLPKWAFGYIQSKEQYYTAKELTETAAHYRSLDIPLDGIVQDWNTWEEGKWGNKILDPARYGDMEEQAEKLHEMHVHTMVSVWPNMNFGTDDHRAFADKGFLLNDLATYDAFDERARALYWEQAKTGLFDRGFDAFWCDSTEPFSGPDWGGEIKREPWQRFELVGNEHKKYLPPEKANAYGLAHAKGMFENQRKTTKEKRVLNLTRSCYAGGQKYGAMLWSGDICASYDTLRRQIAEGLNMGLSGYPYWTYDIGGFFTVGKEWKNRGCGCHNDPTPKWFWRGVYDEGVKDLGYRELYVRFLQMGTFLPMFRSHGTDTPREIWHFGREGEPFYDAIAAFIRLRYRLMPYIYSLAGAVRLFHDTMMRSLLFDHAQDEKARTIQDEFMFGRGLLICPVTEPMYYESGSRPIDREKKRSCYLPKGPGLFYDFFTGESYKDGQTVIADAPLSRIPVFVPAGTILPMREGLHYASEEPDTPLLLQIYPGRDGDLLHYEDAGDGYDYENGGYATVSLHWDEKNRTLSVGARKGSYDGMPAEIPMRILLKDVSGVSREEPSKELVYRGEAAELNFER
ncbi:MAG: DUF5110 domain-containing protein [Lachnospiraceae bacterium]|nr:DUF5110 domain-containing protein [Lachnospiraceae bacterium]